MEIFNDILYNLKVGEGRGERKRELTKKLAKEKWNVERSVWMNFNAIRKL